MESYVENYDTEAENVNKDFQAIGQGCDPRTCPFL